MKKKILGLVALLLSVIFLTACQNNSLDGEYYWISDGRNQLKMSIRGNGGTVDLDGKDYAITNVDSEKNQITVSTDFGNKTFNLNPSKDGKIISPSDDTLYKEGSEACEKALKKYGYREVGKE